MLLRSLLFRLLLVSCCVAETTSSGVSASSVEAPLLSGMGTYPIVVASGSNEAQRYFRQGMTLVWGFNPAEGARAFEAAARLDAHCALCFWGIAWALGPNINSDMAPDAADRISAALARARQLTRRGPARTRGLVGALSVRHARGVLDEAGYARVMRQMAGRFPDDADIATLAAEALLDLHPYDWWRGDGEPKPWTPPIERLLTRALTLEPDHPGANHYWIHLEERSNHPEQALASARRLESLAPGAGHLLHMPAHIHMRIGNYADASRANERSIAADARYEAEVAASGAYRIGYEAHSQHFLWASAAMEGRSRAALEAARAAFPTACGPGRNDRSSGLLQQYYVVPLYAMVRFGRWQEILRDTLPPDVAEPYPLAMWHYARGTAYAKTGNIDAASEELARLQALAASPALRAVKIKNINPAVSLVAIADLTLRSDIALARNDPGAAVAMLAQATATEDALEYDEPHLWLAPTRHALGAALLAAHREVEAEAVFHQDLDRYPQNGWALFGLAAALRAQGREHEAAEVDGRYARAWSAADFRLQSPRL